MRALIGLILIVIGFVLIIFAHDEDNDYYYYTRTFTLISKHQSEHKYKGRYQPEYYITVQYDDDSKFYWTERVGGSRYFSMSEGNRYDTRVSNEKFEIMFWVVLGVFITGIILIAYHMSLYI